MSDRELYEEGLLMDLEIAKLRIEELIAERDHGWKRAGHAEKMWGETEVKLAKALLIIEAYGDDEGYIPKRVVHLWNELTGGKDE